MSDLGHRDSPADDSRPLGFGSPRLDTRYYVAVSIVALAVYLAVSATASLEDTTAVTLLILACTASVAIGSTISGRWKTMNALAVTPAVLLGSLYLSARLHPGDSHTLSLVTFSAVMGLLPARAWLGRIFLSALGGLLGLVIASLTPQQIPTLPTLLIALIIVGVGLDLITSLASTEKPSKSARPNTHIRPLGQD